MQNNISSVGAPIYGWSIFTTISASVSAVLRYIHDDISFIYNLIASIGVIIGLLLTIRSYFRTKRIQRQELERNEQFRRVMRSKAFISEQDLVDISKFLQESVKKKGTGT